MLITKRKMVLNELMIFARLALLMFVNHSCKKDSSQASVTPEPEPYNVVIDSDWASADWVPTKSTIRKYANDKYVDTIFINVANSAHSYCYGPLLFRLVRDTLQTRFDIAPNKVRGMGTIYVDPYHGAQLPNYDIEPGMAIEDSIWFARQGFRIQRYDYNR